VSFLLDTNVVSELRRRAPHPKVAAWHRANAGADVYLSVLVIGEVRQGIEKLRPRDAAQAEALDRWLQGLVRNHAGRILPVTLEVAQWWGRLSAAFAAGPAAQPARSRPVRLPTPGGGPEGQGGGRVIVGLMAATALVHRLTLVTRNVGDVAGTGVAVVNPFQ
jgi:predicted nucleic acid-binding protein